MFKTGIEQSKYYVDKLGAVLGKPDLVDYISEIDIQGGLISSIEKMVAEEEHFITKKFNSIYYFRLYRLVLYCIVRSEKPEKFVETGVLHGLTSVFLLEALKKNSRGKLYSIDYPSYFEKGPSNKDGYNATLPPGKEPGWVVEDHYKDYWELLIGKSTERLPEIFNKLHKIDIFLHDSEHTYETMWFELNTAWKYIREGGYLICDNIVDNTSFFDFCFKVERHPLVFPSPDERINNPVRFGIIKR